MSAPTADTAAGPRFSLGVRARILTTVAVLAVVSVIVTLFATTRITALRQGEDTLYSDHTKPLVELYGLQRHFQSIRARVMLYPSVDAKTRADLRGQIEEFHGNEVKAIETYREHAADPKIFADYEAKFTALYAVMTDKLLAAADKNDLAAFQQVYKDEVKGPLRPPRHPAGGRRRRGCRGQGADRVRRRERRPSPVDAVGAAGRRPRRRDRARPVLRRPYRPADRAGPRRRDGHGPR
ncbi:MAG: MCP four helix bundle domain-containing protein [Kineosporiaceae bacterium]